VTDAGFNVPHRVAALEARLEAQADELEALRRGFVALLHVVEGHAACLDARPEPPPPAPDVATEPACRTCGAPLAGRRPQARFCGDSCRQRARRRRHSSVTVAERDPARDLD
jgi:hypothetical protein